MASFVLQPCRVRGDRLAPLKEDPLRLTWRELLDRLAPSKSRLAQLNLTRLALGQYVGLQHDGTNFIIRVNDHSNDIGWLLEQDPDLPDRVQSVFRVDEAHYDVKVEETGNRTRSGAPPRRLEIRRG